MSTLERDAPSRPSSVVETTGDLTEGTPSDSIDLKSFWFAFRRRLAVFSVVAAVAFLAVAAITWQLTPVYNATAEVLLDPDQAQFLDRELQTGGAPEASVVDTEVELMRSRDLVGRVVDKLDLVCNPEFNYMLQPPSWNEELASNVSGVVTGFFGAVSPSNADEGDSDTGGEFDYCAPGGPTIQASSRATSARQPAARDANPAAASTLETPAQIAAALNTGSTSDDPAGRPRETDDASETPAAEGADDAPSSGQDERQTPTVSTPAPEETADTAAPTAVLAPSLDAQMAEALQPTRPKAPTAVRQAVIDSVLGHIAIQRVRTTYIISVSAKSVDRELAAQIANEVAYEYLNDRLEGQLDGARRVNDWLTLRLDEMSRDLRVAEEDLERRRIALGLQRSTEPSVREQELAELRAQLALENAALSDLNNRLAGLRSQIRAGLPITDFTDVRQSGDIQELGRERTDVLRQIAANSNRGENHPTMIALRQELSDLNAAIEFEERRVVATLESEQRLAAERVRSLEEQIQVVRDALDRGSVELVEVRELERQVEAQRTLYERFLNQSETTDQLETFEQTRARIISAAPIPNWPSSPNKRLNLMLGALFALTLGAAAVFLAETFDSGLRTAEDVQRFFPVRCLGLLPRVRVHNAPGRRTTVADVADYVVAKPMSAFAEALRALRATVLLSRDYPDAKVIVFTSALSGEGKTATALSFARLAAMQGAKVIAVDLDLRRRELTRAARLEPQLGLADFLDQTKSIDEVLHADSQETGLQILPLTPGGAVVPGVDELTGLRTLIKQLREDYDVVVIDTAPVLAVTETRIITALSDAVVFMTRWSNTPRNAVRHALNTLSAVGAPVVGVALSRVNMTSQVGYGQGGGYYGLQYKNYYTD